MQDALLVRVMDRFGSDLHVPRGFGWREWTIANELREVMALDVIHRKEVLAFVHSDFVNGYNVRMLESRRCGRFASKPLGYLFAGELPGQDHLYRDHAIEAPLPRFVNDAHAAAGDFFQKLVIAEGAACGCQSSDSDCRGQVRLGDGLRGGLGALGFEQAEEAVRAVAARGIGWQRFAAIRTAMARIHGLATDFSHTTVLRQN